MTHHHRTTCPFCGEHHDRITHPTEDDSFPEDGDATMCFACGDFCIVDNDSDLGLRKPTKKERRELDADDRIRKLRKAWSAIKQS
jgi:hypothetical protein